MSRFPQRENEGPPGTGTFFGQKDALSRKRCLSPYAPGETGWDPAPGEETGSTHLKRNDGRGVDPVGLPERLRDGAGDQREPPAERLLRGLAELEADLPPFAGDRSLLKRVFGNLIQNSLVHSSSAVELKLLARTDPRGVLFTVADNGPGIPPQYHEVIFHKFERVKTPNVPRVRSSGLGLAFCRLVVEAHGGRIWVQSTEGAGSAFHIVLPVRPPVTPSLRASVGAGAVS